MSWFGELERKLIDTLLRSPAFHKGVKRVHKTVHQIQHGKPPEYHGDETNIEAEQEAGKGISHFFKLFWDELKTGHKPVQKPPRK